MKIAFLNYYQNGVVRGLETFVSELSCRLAKNYQVLLLPSPPVSTPTSTKLSPLRRLFLDPSSLRVLFWTLRSLPSLLRFRPQIVFSTDGGWQALLCSLYCRFFAAKLVITGQSGPGWDDRWNLLMKPHLFVALTNRQLAWAKQATIWKQDFALIPNGVDLNQFKPAGKKFHTDLEKPIIMIAAASTPDKRVEQGIRAVAGLKSGSLLLLGQGPLDERVNKLGYRLLGKKRFHHLSVSHDQMPVYYRSADLFTLCSFSSEAFGIVYLEAMASGLPCVATDDASRREIIGLAGVFVKDPDNAEEYSEALRQALAKNWKDLPRKQAEKFSWNEIAAQYDQEFTKIMKP
ncbi:MAG: glycosyltransferase family 4 protein [Microgenomates group bacterium]